MNRPTPQGTMARALARKGYCKVSDDRVSGRDVLTYRRRIWGKGQTVDTMARVYKNGSIAFETVRHEGIIGL